jgi:hypothetical protein
MPMPAFDPYERVEAALQYGLGRAAAAMGGDVEAQRAPRLAIVCFADAWSPPAVAAVAALEQISGDLRGFAQTFAVDAAQEQERAWEAGVVSTPAFLFYWDGQPVLVRRPDWDDDNKLAGAFGMEQLLEIARHARECCGNASEGEQLILALDF